LAPRIEPSGELEEYRAQLSIVMEEPEGAHIASHHLFDSLLGHVVEVDALFGRGFLIQFSVDVFGKAAWLGGVPRDEAVHLDVKDEVIGGALVPIEGVAFRR